MKKGEKGLQKLLNRSHSRGDLFIPILVIAISLFGLLMIYSASFYQAKLMYKDGYFFFKKQLMGFVLGLVAMIITSLIDYKKLIKIAYPLAVVSGVLLAVVFTPLGVENYGAKRWIGIGSITIQPSEIAKFGFVLFASAYFYKDPSRAKRFTGILPVLGVGGII